MPRSFHGVAGMPDQAIPCKGTKRKTKSTNKFYLEIIFNRWYRGFFNNNVNKYIIDNCSTTLPAHNIPYKRHRVYPTSQQTHNCKLAAVAWRKTKVKRWLNYFTCHSALSCLCHLFPLSSFPSAHSVAAGPLSCSITQLLARGTGGKWCENCAITFGCCCRWSRSRAWPELPRCMLHAASLRLLFICFWKSQQQIINWILRYWLAKWSPRVAAAAAAAAHVVGVFVDLLSQFSRFPAFLLYFCFVSDFGPERIICTTGNYCYLPRLNITELWLGYFVVR